MIFIRDDDVLMASSSWKDPFSRFRQIHEWTMESEKVMHVPTILVTEIQQFPEAIDYIKEETKSGNMKPQLHGYKHVDPGLFTFNEIRNQLKEAKEWMLNVLDIIPTKWYTPWGAGESPHQEYLWVAAEKENLQLVTCKNISKLHGRYGVVQRIKRGHDPNKFLENKEILIHWWQSGNRLKRVIDFIETGEGIEVDPK